MSQETHVSGALARHLPTFVIILMAIQPRWTFCPSGRTGSA